MNILKQYIFLPLLVLASCSYIDYIEEPAIFLKAAPEIDWTGTMSWEEFSLRKGDSNSIKILAFSQTDFQPSHKVYFDVSIDNEFISFKDSLGEYADSHFSEDDFYNIIPDFQPAYKISYMIYTEDLEPGEHTLNIRAHDYYKAESTQNYTFIVEETNLPTAVVDSMRVEDMPGRTFDYLHVFVTYSAIAKPVKEIKIYIDDWEWERSNIYDIDMYSGQAHGKVHLHDSEISPGQHILKLEVIDEDFSVMMKESYTFTK